jgi:4-hydroxy-tetrahydrodipicolinate synthase
MRTLKELKARMKGVNVVQLTPFNQDGSLDLQGMRANTRWLAERAAGKDFIFTPVGSTGEFYAMSDEECKAVIKAVVEETDRRAVIMAGAGRAGTLETIKLCQYAQSVGADGAQVILPYYHIPEEEGMYLHYKQICENVDPNFGIIVYNNPDVSGSWIKPHLMQKITKLPNVIGIKENIANFGSYLEMRRAVDPNDAAIFCGIGEVMYSVEALFGCDGIVSGNANFCPDLVYSLYEAASAKDFIKVTEKVYQLLPIFDFVRKLLVNHGPATNVPGYGGAQAGFMLIGARKAVMDMLGLKGGPPRLPLVGLTEEEKGELRRVLEGMKLIDSNR